MRTALVFGLLWIAGSASALTGREVIDAAQKKNGFSTWRDRTQRATMDTYSGNSLTRTRDMKIFEQTDPQGEHRTRIDFTAPADVLGTRFLHKSPRGEPDQQWLWSPTTRRVRRIGESQSDEQFFGADLSYRDLELMVRIQQWTDADSTATLEGEETIDGSPCYVVLLVPKNDEFKYAHYKMWFTKDASLLWRVDVFDEGSAPLKRIHPREYRAVGPYQTATKAEVVNLKQGSRTNFTLRDIEYDTGIDEDEFSVSELQQS